MRRKFKSERNENSVVRPVRIASGKDSTALGIKSKKIPVALRFDENLLTAIDVVAAKRGLSRNGIISYWCSKGVERE